MKPHSSSSSATSASSPPSPPSLHLKTNGIYIVGRLVPAALSFLAIGWYTHLVTPAEYGFYALVVLGATLGNLGLFQWLRVSVLRLAPGENVELATLRVTALAAFLGLVGVTGFLGTVVVLTLPPTSSLPHLLLYVLPLMWAFAWSDLNLDWLRARLAPWRYTALYLGRATLTILLALLLANAGWGGEGLAMGAIVGAFVPGFFFLRFSCEEVKSGRMAWALLRRMGAYGLPLAAAFALASLVNGLDRLLLTALGGAVAVGLYAAAYDLARNTLYVLMQSINLGAFPLAIRALEKEGPAAARQQLQRNAALLAFLSFPAAGGLVSLAPALVKQFLSPDFQDVALLVFAPIVLATLLSGWRTFYLDQSFQLGQETGPQFRLMIIGLVVSGGLNALLIPRAGAVGAAWANVMTFGLLALLSWFWGRRLFPLPLPQRDIGLILLSTAVMLAVLAPFSHWNSFTGLGVRLFIGGCAYGMSCIALDVMGLRQRIRRPA